MIERYPIKNYEYKLFFLWNFAKGSKVVITYNILTIIYFFIFRYNILIDSHENDINEKFAYVEKIYD